MDIYAVSDLHADFPANFSWIENFYHKNKFQFKNDVCIIAGDISHKIYLVEHVLLKFKEIFGEVAFTVGNHELWQDKKHKLNSYEKMERIEDFCRKNEIKIEPFVAEDTVIVPVYAWYNDDFASDDEKQDPSLEGWADRYLCNFHKTNHELCHFFNAKNAPLRQASEKVLSFSHFIPRKELLPPTDSLLFKGLPAVAGNILIDQYIRSIGAKIHISGHAHLDLDLCIDGIRYLQHPLKYPHEQTLDGKRDLLKIIF